VRVFSQNTANRCWEACARIMWHYRHYGNDGGYAATARGYTTLDRGLVPAEMDAFYVGLLRMRHIHHPTPAQFRARLNHGPVIFTVVNGPTGHAMVAAGFNPNGRHYEVVDPFQGGTEMIFDDQGNAAGFHATGRLVFRRARELDPRLGEFIWFW